MPNSADSVSTGKCRRLHERLEDFSRRTCSGNNIIQVEAVQSTVQSKEKVPLVIAKVRRSLDHLVEYLNIKGESVDVLIHNDEVCLTEVVELLMRGGEFVPVQSRLEGRNSEDQGVCSSFHDKVDC